MLKSMANIEYKQPNKQTNKDTQRHSNRATSWKARLNRVPRKMDQVPPSLQRIYFLGPALDGGGLGEGVALLRVGALRGLLGLRGLLSFLGRLNKKHARTARGSLKRSIPSPKGTNPEPPGFSLVRGDSWRQFAQKDPEFAMKQLTESGGFTFLGGSASMFSCSKRICVIM